MLKKLCLKLDCVFEPFVTFDRKSSSLLSCNTDIVAHQINLDVKEVALRLKEMFDYVTCVSIIPIKSLMDLDSVKMCNIFDSPYPCEYGINLYECDDDSPLDERTLSLENYSLLRISDDYSLNEKILLENIFEENSSKLKQECLSIVKLQLQYLHLIVTDSRTYFNECNDRNYKLSEV